ncbi:hypothetical protein [uncultured Massilia sp.]|uniref:hypothetical protein n=1 Tax=uncultured Massilia sp. TaxID=169973 RepID=UPI00258ADCAF|nr:hypothetical protein [uncultured Massilia sp.]
MAAADLGFHAAHLVGGRAGELLAGQLVQLTDLLFQRHLGQQLLDPLGHIVHRRLRQAGAERERKCSRPDQATPIPLHLVSSSGWPGGSPLVIVYMIDSIRGEYTA